MNRRGFLATLVGIWLTPVGFGDWRWWEYFFPPARVYRWVQTKITIWRFNELFKKIYGPKLADAIPSYPVLQKDVRI